MSSSRGKYIKKRKKKYNKRIILQQALAGQKMSRSKLDKSFNEGSFSVV